MKGRTPDLIKKTHQISFSKDRDNEGFIQASAEPTERNESEASRSALRDK